MGPTRFRFVRGTPSDENALLVAAAADTLPRQGANDPRPMSGYTVLAGTFLAAVGAALALTPASPAFSTSGRRRYRALGESNRRGALQAGDVRRSRTSPAPVAASYFMNVARGGAFTALRHKRPDRRLEVDEHRHNRA